MATDIVRKLRFLPASRTPVNVFDSAMHRSATQLAFDTLDIVVLE